MLSRIIRSNIFARRGLHITSILRTEGATASGSKGFAQKEKAIENQWARHHNDELLQSLKQRISEQEKATADIKQKLAELQAKHK